jgi:hypothetical protein
MSATRARRLKHLTNNLEPQDCSDHLDASSCTRSKSPKRLRSIKQITRTMSTEGPGGNETHTAYAQSPRAAACRPREALPNTRRVKTRRALPRIAMICWLEGRVRRCCQAALVACPTTFPTASLADWTKTSGAWEHIDLVTRWLFTITYTKGWDRSEPRACIA